MKKKMLVVVAVALCVLVAGISLVLGAYLNSITFHYDIGPGASLSASIALNMTADNNGVILENSAGGSGPEHNGLPVVANSTLTMTQTGNVTISFGNSSDLSPFSMFQCTVQLYRGGSPAYTGSISNTALSYTIPNVIPGAYPIYVGYTFIAGSNSASGSIIVNVSSP